MSYFNPYSISFLDRVQPFFRCLDGSRSCNEAVVNIMSFDREVVDGTMALAMKEGCPQLPWGGSSSPWGESPNTLDGKNKGKSHLEMDGYLKWGTPISGNLQRIQHMIWWGFIRLTMGFHGDLLTKIGGVSWEISWASPYQGQGALQRTLMEQFSAVLGSVWTDWHPQHHHRSTDGGSVCGYCQLRAFSRHVQKEDLCTVLSQRSMAPIWSSKTIKISRALLPGKFVNSSAPLPSGDST